MSTTGNTQREQFDAWLIETTDAIVSAGLDPALWSGIPEQIAKGWPGTAPAFQSYDARSRHNVGAQTHGWNPSGVAAYAEYYARLNPWTPLIAKAAGAAAFNSGEHTSFVVPGWNRVL